MSWFVANIREQEWQEVPGFDAFANWQQGESFPQVGVNVSVLPPGHPMCMYHRESRQEGFLVLSGECVLLVDGEEHRLRAWDYFHCPANVNHIIVGAGDKPATLITIGARFGPNDVVYPVDPVAQAYGACVPEETTDPKVAYAPFEKPRPVAFREDFLPG